MLHPLAPLGRLLLLSEANHSAGTPLHAADARTSLHILRFCGSSALPPHSNPLLSAKRRLDTLINHPRRRFKPPKLPSAARNRSNFSNNSSNTRQTRQLVGRPPRRSRTPYHHRQQSAGESR